MFVASHDDLLYVLPPSTPISIDLDHGQGDDSHFLEADELAEALAEVRERRHLHLIDVIVTPARKEVRDLEKEAA